MTRGAMTKSSRGAVATGASAAGAASFGAMALGAVALGAVAVGALAVGRLSVGRARLRRVEIGELTVGRLDVGADGTGGKLAALARIRAAPGKGDALERLLRDHAAASEPGALLYRAHRSPVDPDRFMFHEAYTSEESFERHAQAPLFGDVLRLAAEEGLIAASADDPVEIELYRTI
jgi:quinol monooxygenase YgiN